MEEKSISFEYLNMLQLARYRVTTVVPLCEKPVIHVRILDQTGLDALLEGYEEYAEFLISIEILGE